MRAFLTMVSVAAAVALLPNTLSTSAKAADGCSYGPGGQLYCQPGASPGTPYGYGRRDYRQDYGDQTPYSERSRHRYRGRNDLNYLCSLGSQTPRSVRHLC